MRQRYRSALGDHLHVRVLSSGRTLAIREWMTWPEAAAWSVRDHPRLSREALSDLRMIVDTVVCTLADDGDTDEAEQANDTTGAAVRAGRTRRHPGGRPKDGAAEACMRSPAVKR